MGTKCIGPQIGEAESGGPFSSDGFLSLTSFTLKKIHNELETSCVSPVAGSLAEQLDMDIGCSISDDVKLARCLRRRPWINYGMFDVSSDEESDMEKFNVDGSSKLPLPKGVIRGCSNCCNCQKVVARWCPDDAHRPIINEAPVFYPNEEEFKDTLKYIASIQDMVEPYGICRIVPPPSWKPPCPLKEKNIWEKSKFATRIQQLDKLQNREPMRKKSRMVHIRKKRRSCLKAGTSCGDADVGTTDAHEGINENERFGFLPGPEFTLESFEKHADDFIEQYFGLKDMGTLSNSGQNEAKYQREPSVEEIEGEYWRMVEKPTEEIEVLYGADLETGAFGSGFPKAHSGSGDSGLDAYVRSGWNLNNFPRLPGSVLSFEKSDISGVLVPWLYIGMCFSSFCWHVEDHHLYSLNYMHWGAPKLWYGVPRSYALKLEAAMKKYLPELFEEQPDLLHKLVTQLSPTILKSEGVPVYRCVQRSGEFVLTFPRAYHSGFNCGFNCAEAVNVAPVDWLPHGQSAVELYAQQHRRTSLSHDKLLLGAAQDAVRALWELHLLRKETPDNLRWQAVCGKDGILTMALKTRVDIERARRQFFCNPSQVRKMDVDFDATNERECIICFYDLHLSAAGCECSPETFACLNHAKQLCSCAWSRKFFLFRYEVMELDICMEALGGKLSAIHRWANLYLGLSLSSHATKKDSSQVFENQGALVNNAFLEETKSNEGRLINDVSLKSITNVDMQHLETNRHLMQPSSLDKTETKDYITQSTVEFLGARSGHLQPELKTPRADLSSKVQISVSKHDTGKVVGVNEPCKVKDEDGIAFSNRNVQEPSSPKISKFSCRKLQSGDGDLALELPVESFTICQLSEEDTSYSKLCENSSTRVHRSTFSPSFADHKLSNSETSKSKSSIPSINVICLSDDDGDQVEGSRSLIGAKAEESPKKHMKVSETFVAIKNDTVDSESQGNRVPGIQRTIEPATVNGEGKQLGMSTQNVSSHASAEVVSSSTRDQTCLGNLSSSSNLHDLASDKGLNKHHIANRGISENYLQHLDLNSPGNLGNVQKRENLSSHSVSIQVKNGSCMQSTVSPSQAQNLNKNCQKGPRIAKVVRRFNCTVELLDFGVVTPGKAWCNRQTVFPNGFRSRVRYFSVFDPRRMCYYVSEILDAGNSLPIFRVTLEDCPTEVFVNVSAGNCWDMVREKVNQQIARRHNQERPNLPSLQLHGSLDGFEMFGLSSPSFIQKIPLLDPGHLCLEYWNSRASDRNLVKPLPKISSDYNQNKVGTEEDKKKAFQSVECILKCLFKNANPQELHALHHALSNENLCFNRAMMIQALKEEIQERQRRGGSSNVSPSST